MSESYAAAYQAFFRKVIVYPAGLPGKPGIGQPQSHELIMISVELDYRTTHKKIKCDTKSLVKVVPTINDRREPPVSPGEATGEVVSEPLADRKYSGRFIVRVPSLVHRALATEAAEQGVSINRLVSAKLAM